MCASLVNLMYASIMSIEQYIHGLCSECVAFKDRMKSNVIILDL